MSVSSVHSAPHRRRGLFIEVPLQHQSCVIIRWWPFCWLPGDPGLCTLDLQFSTKEWYVCIVVGQFLCIRGCNENWPLEIGFWEVYLPVNSVSHTFARIFLDGRYAFPSHSPCIHGVLRSTCINGVVTRNSHQAAGFLAWLRHPESFCKFPAPRLWTRVGCGKTHSPALVSLSSPFSFWPRGIPILIEFFSKIEEEGTLPSSFDKASIMLINPQQNTKKLNSVIYQ